MNIYNFLLIDAAFVLAGIPILFLLKGGKKKYPLSISSSKERHLNKTSITLPDKEKLLELEKLAKNQGSGIEFYSLIGDWKFVSVWKKDINEEDPVFSSLLRIFSANIELKKDKKTDNLQKYYIVTSIQFGLLSIELYGRPPPSLL